MKMNSHLNSELLNELRELMEDDFSVLLETYLAESQRQLRGARGALENDDLEALKRFAHSLKGSSSNIGAEVLSVLCGKLESGARHDEREVLPQLLAEVAGELGDVCGELEAMRTAL
jgi:HPt (histidine-containing phosphotransfer) domain-containing protein